MVGYPPQYSWASLVVQLVKKEKKVKLLSHVGLFAAPWTVAHQTPPSVEFSRQEYWSGLPFPFPGDLPDPGIKSRSTTMQVDALLSELVKNLPAMRETWV